MKTSFQTHKTIVYICIWPTCSMMNWFDSHWTHFNCALVLFVCIHLYIVFVDQRKQSINKRLFNVSLCLYPRVSLLKVTTLRYKLVSWRWPSFVMITWRYTLPVWKWGVRISVKRSVCPRGGLHGRCIIIIIILN